MIARHARIAYLKRTLKRLGSEDQRLEQLISALVYLMTPAPPLTTLLTSFRRLLRTEVFFVIPLGNFQIPAGLDLFGKLSAISGEQSEDSLVLVSLEIGFAM